MREEILSLSNLFGRLAGRTRRALWPVPGMCALSELLGKGTTAQGQIVRMGTGQTSGGPLAWPRRVAEQMAYGRVQGRHTGARRGRTGQEGSHF